MKYVDIHSHILFNDDGPSTIEESLDILITAKQYHTNAVCFTPHLYLDNPLDINEIITNTSKIKEQTTTNITLFYGAEINIDPALPEFITANPGFCLGDSKYVLVELPFLNYPIYVKEVLYALNQRGFKVIIAHPERYRISQINMDKFLYDVDDLAYFQVNASSIAGKYGVKVEKAAYKFLKDERTKVIASDTHRKRDIVYLESSYKKVEKEYGKKHSENLFFYNPYKILKDKKI